MGRNRAPNRCRNRSRGAESEAAMAAEGPPCPGQEPPCHLPGPYALPVIGNVFDIDNVDVPLLSLQNLAEKYGEVYQLRFPGQNPVMFISSVSLTNEICNEKRFRKKISSLLVHLSKGVRKSMFTVNTYDEAWGVAHRILMPAFGTASIRSMLPEMKEITNQMVLKWARHGQEPICVTEDMTRLTLDILGLCGMGFRFNSFYRPDRLHPFVESMQQFMSEADRMVRRLPLLGLFYRSRDRQFWRDIGVMRGWAEEIVRARRNNLTGVHGTKRTDLLEVMLDCADPKTGKKLTEDLVVDNLTSFLAAGHETTSGMLSFALYELLCHPEALRRTRDEVDAVCGRGPVTAEHLGSLNYVTAVLRETLRLHPTIPGFMVEAVEDTVIGGGFVAAKGQTVTCLVESVHLDKAVYGEDSHEFKPERMSNDAFRDRQRRFGNCWKPFGNGSRSCIGRPFAWQEGLLALAVILQNFDVALADPGYKLRRDSLKSLDRDTSIVAKNGL
ncbi:bifunctional P-450/NADPH-P450 reductase [Diaporthe helianthi]|uniref:Bifunctional P-450/NADPH-P450 reductase n=1 Tax=Diaporthe helianthi TaxID=158607 RepID=A0A2P5HGH5_DIAHE|nr:bifunctional P-450/NADPH-P450 reductase [Diaporthe helianthi]